MQINFYISDFIQTTEDGQLFYYRERPLPPTGNFTADLSEAMKFSSEYEAAVKIQEILKDEPGEYTIIKIYSR